MGFSKIAHEGNRFRFQIKDKFIEESLNNLDSNNKEDQRLNSHHHHHHHQLSI